MENSLKGKIALVTGATSGIGRSCAIELAKLGCSIIISGRREQLLAELQYEIESLGSKAVPLVMDVSKSSDVFDKLNSLPNEWCSIDILINNAGVALGMGKIFELEPEEIDTMVDTNLKGMIYVIRAVVPQMIHRDAAGIVINIGSVAGKMVYPGGHVYCGTKAGVRFISDGLRIDTMDTRIRVTEIQPGLVKTNFSMVKFHGDKERFDEYYKGIEPLTGDDIAQTVAYICTLPENVQLPQVVMTCNKQADAMNKHFVNNTFTL